MRGRSRGDRTKGRIKHIRVKKNMVTMRIMTG